MTAANVDVTTADKMAAIMRPDEASLKNADVTRRICDVTCRNGGIG